MDIQAIAFDLDDTLLRDDLTISLYTVDILNRAAAKGIRIIPATGRIQGSILDYLRQIGCADCYITGNGGQLWSADHKLLHEQKLDAFLMEEIVDYGLSKGVYMHTYHGNRFHYSTEENGYAAKYAQVTRLQGRYEPDFKTFAQSPALKVVFMAEPQLVNEMLIEAGQLFGSRVQVCCSKPTFLEFNALGASKGFALQTAARIRGFSLKKTVAFGDSLNDISMLTAAGTGVAVANAREDVLKAIPIHCAGNNVDGVAHFIEENYL